MEVLSDVEFDRFALPVGPVEFDLLGRRRQGHNFTHGALGEFLMRVTMNGGRQATHIRSRQPDVGADTACKNFGGVNSNAHAQKYGLFPNQNQIHIMLIVFRYCAP